MQGIHPVSYKRFVGRRKMITSGLNEVQCKDCNIRLDICVKTHTIRVTDQKLQEN